MRMRNWLRIILGGIGIFCFGLFLLPKVSAGILNIGNITGILVSVMIMAYALFQRRIHGWIRKIWNKGKTNRFLLCIVGGMMAAIVLLATVGTGCMMNACSRTPKSNATAIVLGCRVYGDWPSLMLRERMNAAIEYLNGNPEAMCVVSGGQGSGEDISEAECMYRYMTEHGIDGARIYKEEKSTSTEENMEFSLAVIKQNNLPEEIAIVSNEFHIYRAGLIASDCGLEFGTVPANTALWLLPTYYVRELYAILAEWIL